MPLCVISSATRLSSKSFQTAEWQNSSRKSLPAGTHCSLGVKHWRFTFCVKFSRPSEAMRSYSRRAILSTLRGARQKSKPRNIRKRHAAGVHVHAAELGAAVQGREHLAG